MIKKVVFLVTCSLVLMACKDKKNQTEKSSDPEKGLTAVIPQEASYAFVGTYTRDEGFVNGQAEGVYLLKRNEDDASLLKQKVAAEVTNPSYLAVSPDRNNLYVVSEVGREGETGAVHVYDLSDFQNPVHLQEISTDAKAPCYVGLDGKGDYVFAVNYAGGVVKMYKRDKKGMLTPADAVQLHGSGPDKGRQAESHPHSLFLSPDNRFAYVPDLGSDKIWTFRIDREQHKLLPLSDGFVATRPGAGPRHIAFHPNGKYAYLINELDNTVNAYAFDSETGILSEIQTLSTLPEDFKGTSSGADIHIHPNGRFLYGSNRGDDSIVVYAIHPENGKLSVVQFQPVHGKFPRNFAIHPSGKTLYAANQNSGNIARFTIDENTGKLEYASETAVNTPVCIKFYP